MLRVADEVLDETQWPAVLDPLIGPEVRLDVPALEPSPSNQTAPRVAADSGGAAIAWLDNRSGRTRAFAMALTLPNADPASMMGSAIGSVDARSVDAAVGGGSALVVVAGAGGILATPMSALGILGATRALASTPRTSYPSVRVAWDGASFVVVWTELPSGGIAELHIARVDATGALVLGPAALPMTEAVFTPSIACGATGCAVAFCGVTGVRAFRLDASLAPLDATPVSIDASAERDSIPAIAAVTTGWVVAWVPPLTMTRGLVAARLATDGSVTGEMTISPDRGTSSVSLVATGDRVLAAWSAPSTDQVLVRELTHTGAPTGPLLSIEGTTSTLHTGTSIASTGSRSIVAWSRQMTASGPGHVRLARLSMLPALLDPLGGLGLVSTAPAVVEARVAWDGIRWLLVWEQRGSATLGDIYGARIRADGTVQDPLGFAIANTADDEDEPEVASTVIGRGWGVVHRGRRSEPILAFVSTGGAVTSSTVLSAGESTNDLVLGATAVRYLALWGDFTVRYRRFDIDGVSLDASPRSVDLGSSRPRAIVGDLTSFALAWRAGSTRIRTASISGAGTFSPATGFDTLFGESVTGTIEAALGGGAHWLAWERATGSAALPNTVRASQYTPGGAAIGSTADIHAGWLPGATALVYDGTSFDLFYARAVSFDGIAWLEVVRRAPDGTMVDPIPVVLARAADGLEVLDAASDGAGHVLLVYSSYDAAAGARRATMRLLDMRATGSALPLGTGCTSPWECASGFCSDGVCCDSACGDGATGDCGTCLAARGAPADGTCGPLAADTTCRGAAGSCDAREVCDGVSPDCPPDMRLPAATICTPVSGECRTPGRCDGVAVTCGSASLLPAGTVCRGAVGSCDVAEVCDGASETCPPDQALPAGTECRRVRGDCDVADRCDGVTSNCPPDVVLAAGRSCRAAVGPCDAAEFCDGTSPGCPFNAYLAAGEVCAPGADACAMPSTCSGDSASCLATPAPEGTPCRAATGPCDAAELCDGVDLACPPDARATDGTPCGDGSFCGPLRTCGRGECVIRSPSRCGPGTTCNEEARACVLGASSGCGCRAAHDAPRGALLTCGVLALMIGLRRRR